MFGGSDEPCANVFFMCIGKMGPEENKAHAANLFPVIAKYLGVSQDRFYILFRDAPTHEWHGKEQLSRIFLENKVVKPKYIQPSRNPNVSNFFHYCFQKKGNKLRLKLCQAQVQLKLS